MAAGPALYYYAKNNCVVRPREVGEAISQTAEKLSLGAASLYSDTIKALKFLYVCSVMTRVDEDPCVQTFGFVSHTTPYYIT